MKRIQLLMVLTLVLVFLAGGIGYADENQQKMSNEEAEMMKKWSAYSTPGDFHKGMEYFVGTWKVDSQYWMKADAPPMKSEMTSVQEMILGGRYLKSVTKGMSMGMPFEGHNYTAYDNSKKKYVGTWMDNMGTGIILLEGQPLKEGKGMELSSVFQCPITGEQVSMRCVTKIVDKDKYIFQIFEKGGMAGPIERKTMEMINIRQK